MKVLAIITKETIIWNERCFRNRNLVGFTMLKKRSIDIITRNQGERAGNEYIINLMKIQLHLNL